MHEIDALLVVNDANGVVLYANQGASQFDPTKPNQGTGRIQSLAGGYQGGSIGDYSNPGHVQRQFVVNGEVLARYGDAPDPASASSNPGYISTAEFSLASSPLQLRGANADPVQYTVVEGESLKSIARAVLGDANLWYTIAQANGLSGTETLSAGQVLTVPKTLVSANNSSIFKPYDPTQVRGDTNPVQPDLVMPSGGGGGGCGGLGQIVMLVVAVVVAVETGYYLNFSPTAGFTASNVAISASAAAAGSVASQVVGNAIGAQQGFSWNAVAMSALSAGVGLGMGELAGGSGVLSGSGYGMTAARAAVGNALTQGIAVTTGLQQSFSWSSVAASAVGAGVGQVVGGAMGLNDPGFKNLSPGEQFGARLVTGLAAGTAAAVARGGRVSVQQVATDAFGNALGNSMADALRPQNSAQQSFRLDEIRAQNVQAQTDMSGAQSAFRAGEIAYQNGSLATKIGLGSDNVNYAIGTLPAPGRAGNGYITDTSTDAEIRAFDLKNQGFGDDWSLDNAALKFNRKTAFSGSGLKSAINPFSYKSKLDYSVEADYSLDVSGQRLSTQMEVSGWQAALDTAKGVLNSVVVSPGDVLLKVAGYMALSDPSVIYARTQNPSLSAELDRQAASGMAGLSLPRFDYSTPYGPLAEQVSDYAQLGMAGYGLTKMAFSGLNLGLKSGLVGAAGLSYSLDAEASPLSGLRRMMTSVLGDSRELVRMTDTGVAVFRTSETSYAQIGGLVVNRGSAAVRNDLAALRDLEPIAGSVQRAAQEIRDGYRFDGLSNDWQKALTQARIDYAKDPWIISRMESGAIGGYVDREIGLKLRRGEIPEAVGFTKNSVGPDLTKLGSLPIEVTQYTSSLNAIVTHAQRYNQSLAYALYSKPGLGLKP